MTFPFIKIESKEDEKMNTKPLVFIFNHLKNYYVLNS